MVTQYGRQVVSPVLLRTPCMLSVGQTVSHIAIRTFKALKQSLLEFMWATQWSYWCH